MPLKHDLSWVMTRVSVERNLSSQAMTARRAASCGGGVSKLWLLLVGLLVGGGDFWRLTSKLVGVIGTVTNTRRPLPESNQAAAAECHRPAPARASPRTILPIPQERSARLIFRPRPRRGLSPAQYSAPSLAGAAGEEGAAHTPPRRARPLSRRVAAIASRCRWTAMGPPPPVASPGWACWSHKSRWDPSILQAASACACEDVHLQTRRPGNMDKFSL